MSCAMLARVGSGRKGAQESHQSQSVPRCTFAHQSGKNNAWEGQHHRWGQRGTSQPCSQWPQLPFPWHVPSPFHPLTTALKPWLWGPCRHRPVQQAMRQQPPARVTTPDAWRPSPSRATTRPWLFGWCSAPAPRPWSNQHAPLHAWMYVCRQCSAPHTLAQGDSGEGGGCPLFRKGGVRFFGVAYPGNTHGSSARGNAEPRASVRVHMPNWNDFVWLK